MTRRTASPGLRGAVYRLHGESLGNRFSGGKAGTLWYYRAVVTVLDSVNPGPLVEKVDPVAELERSAAAQSQK